MSVRVLTASEARLAQFALPAARLLNTIPLFTFTAADVVSASANGQPLTGKFTHSRLAVDALNWSECCSVMSG
jgi:hypothetical protein